MEVVDIQGREPQEVVSGDEVIENLEEVLEDREVIGDLEKMLAVR